MRYQLSLDSCTKACSVALTPLDSKAPLDGGKAFAWFEILERGHAEIIAHQAQLLMQDAGIKAQDISQIAVTIGPGTFTGARIALAFARMFAAARDIPIIAVNSLEAIAFNAINNLKLIRNDIVYTAIDARRGQVYFASYDGTGGEGFAPQAIEIATAAEMIKSDSLILGTGRELLIEAFGKFSDVYELNQAMHFPQAKIFGERIKNRVAETAPVSPLYLRAADAKLPASHPITFTQ